MLLEWLRCFELLGDVVRFPTKLLEPSTSDLGAKPSSAHRAHNSQYDHFVVCCPSQCEFVTIFYLRLLTSSYAPQPDIMLSTAIGGHSQDGQRQAYHAGGLFLDDAHHNLVQLAGMDVAVPALVPFEFPRFTYLIADTAEAQIGIRCFWAWRI